MRVNLLGNICNNSFDLAKALREIGVDAHLYLTWADQAHPQTRPESSDPSLRGGYPDWIHELDVPLARFRHRGWAPRRVREELAACDIIHTHGHYATWIMGERTPYVIQPFGSDFFVMPFGRPGRSWTTLEDLVPDYRWLGFSRRVREAYRRSSAIVLFNVDHLWERAYRNLVAGRRIGVIGLIQDTDAFAPGTGDCPPLVTELRRSFDLLLFQPTRQIWTDAGRRATGDYSYGNDLFLRGLARAVRAGVRACAILVDKGSICTGASRRLIDELGIAANVRWIKAMPRYQLIDYYRHVDLTIDAFYAGGFGSACLEAMACCCPVLMYLDEEANREVFGEVAPVVNARTEVDVGARLQHHATPAGRTELVDMGVRARAFVERHHASRAVAPRYLSLYRGVLGLDREFQFADPDLYLRLESPLPPASRLPFLHPGSRPARQAQRR